MRFSPWREHADDGGAVYVHPDPQPEGARVCFFTRKGGVSQPPYNSLNVSSLVGDDPVKVAENRARVQAALDGKDSAWVRQVAGDTVWNVEEPGLAGEGDALVSDVAGLPLAVAVADCVPVVLIGGARIGMIHSGWRGTLLGISGKVARDLAGTDGNVVRAYIGPCIRRCCYEVSEELAGRFADVFGSGVASGRMLSLPDAIRADLEQTGFAEVHDLGLCTGCRPDLFYSHRKQKPATGRNLAVATLRNGGGR